MDTAEDLFFGARMKSCFLPYRFNRFKLLQSACLQDRRER